MWSLNWARSSSVPPGLVTRAISRAARDLSCTWCQTQKISV
jgi:hypothetical protein